MTITTGCWIAGVPTLTSGPARGQGFVAMIGFAVGSIATGAWLARPARHGPREHARLGLDLPAYLLLAVAGTVPVAFAAAVGTGGRAPRMCAELGRAGGIPTRCWGGCSA
jgi:hypothetical protein